MIDVSAGRWGLSRAVLEDGGWRSYASAQRLAPRVVNKWAPFDRTDGKHTLDVVLVHLVGPFTAPTDGNTILLPYDVFDDVEITLGNLSARERTDLLLNLSAWLRPHRFFDWDGARVNVPAFRMTRLSDATTLRQLVQFIAEHLGHSKQRPRPGVVETHNTEYTDDFSTDASSRWSNPGFDAAGTWDGTNFEATVGGDNNFGWLYSANNPGSIEHEAQTLSITHASQRAIGPGVRMRTSQADAYGCSLDQFGNVQIWKFVNNSRSELAIQSGLTYTNGHWVYMRLAASGGVGSNVSLPFWYVTTGSSTKPGSDGGWQGVDGSPNYTFSDTAGDRLDDSVHTYCGISARANLSTTRVDNFRERAISDRGGGGTEYEQDLNATAGSSAAIVKSCGKIITIAGGSAATLIKQAAKIISASSTGSAALAAGLQFLKSLSASSAGAVTMLRSVGKIVSATSAGAATMTRITAFARTLSATASSAVTITKQVGKALAASSVGDATLSATRVVLVTLAANAIGAVALTMIVGKLLTVQAGNLVTITKVVSKALSASATGTASLAKRLFQTLSASSVVSAVISTILTVGGNLLSNARYHIRDAFRTRIMKDTKRIREIK